jgi:hypothetical protein
MVVGFLVPRVLPPPGESWMMPVHDWTRVRPGTFPDFHGSWMTHLKETLNDSLLPSGYDASPGLPEPAHDLTKRRT